MVISHDSGTLHCRVVPSPKRERKREGRLVRQEALAAARRRQARRRQLIAALVVAALVLPVLVLVALQGNQSDQDTGEAASTTSSTVVLEAVPAGASVTGETPCPPADGSAPRTSAFDRPPPLCIDPSRSYVARVRTTKGSFTIDLDAAKAPKAVNNFVVLARHHYYDGAPFHRIIPGFVVQGGDPEATGRGGPGYTFEDELPASAAEYVEGSVAMANPMPNANGSQFFVVTAKEGASSFEPRYSLFGKVVEGFEVVKRIEAVGTESGAPTEVVKVISIVIEEG